MYTVEEKLAEVRRELGMRRRIYPVMTGNDHLASEEANRRIRIMEEIAQDYVKLAEGERLI
jgi:hypothetical protein